MQVPEMKQKLEEIVRTLPERELEVIIDFASYLRDREQAKEFLGMQMSSKAYHEWLNPQNDVYDEAFKDAIPYSQR